LISFEVQVNNSHSDWKRTAGLYDIKGVKEVFVKDYEWFTEYIRVEDTLQQKLMIKYCATGHSRMDLRCLKVMPEGSFPTSLLLCGTGSQKRRFLKT
jgi:hypothetical protein